MKNKILITALLIVMIASSQHLFAQERFIKEWKKFNTFFSNFSEAGLPDFDQKTLEDKILESFAIRHLYLNRFNRLKNSPDNPDKIVPEKWVQDTAEKFFGKTIAKPTSENGKYKVPVCEGEGYTFSQVNSMKQIATNTFVAQINVFSSYAGVIVDPHGDNESWKKEGEDVALIGVWKAEFTNLSEGPFPLKLQSYKKISGPALNQTTEPTN
jgi:hypothetical protein